LLGSVTSRVEIVVVDDGSPQPVNLSSLARQGPPLRLVRQPNRGPAAARNTGARLAQAPIIAFTDDDCEPRPDWARKLADAVGTGGHPTLAGGTTRNAVNGNLFSAASQDIANNLSTAFSSEPFFASNNFAVPRDAFLALEGFDEGYPLAAGEDRAFCRDWICERLAHGIRTRCRRRSSSRAHTKVLLAAALPLWPRCLSVPQRHRSDGIHDRARKAVSCACCTSRTGKSGH
jgi:glycosyltransferase involved in cell wall biosynthesis